MSGHGRAERVRATVGGLALLFARFPAGDRERIGSIPGLMAGTR